LKFGIPEVIYWFRLYVIEIVCFIERVKNHLYKKEQFIGHSHIQLLILNFLIGILFKKKWPKS